MSAERLEELLAEREIIRCLTRYARGVDRHDVQLIRSAFHPDAVARHGTFEGTPDVLADWLNDFHSSYTRGHQHLISNFTIALAGDVANCETYVNFVLWRRQGGVVDINGGRYIDRFERRGGEWRIADRTVVVDWAAEAPEGSHIGELSQYAWGAWDTNDPSFRIDPKPRS